MEWIVTIKKEYVDKIINGTKLYEVRKKVPSELRPNDVVYICEGKSGGKVVAKFKVEAISKYGKFGAWIMKSRYLGIKKEDYYKYLHGQPCVLLIRIKCLVEIKDELNVTMLGVKRAPQWFARVER